MINQLLAYYFNEFEKDIDKIFFGILCFIGYIHNFIIFIVGQAELEQLTKKDKIELPNLEEELKPTTYAIYIILFLWFVLVTRRSLSNFSIYYRNI